MKKPHVTARYIFWLLPLAVLLTATHLHAEPVLLQYGHSAGTSLTYQFTMETPAPQSAMRVIFELVRNVVAVDGGDVMEIHSTINNGTVTSDGVSSPLPISGDIMTTLMTRNGVANQTTATGDLGTLFGQAGVAVSSTSPDIFRSLGILEFPASTVDVGATWNVSKNYTFANGDTLQITYDYTLDSFVTHGGYDCARILISAQPQFSFFQDFPDLLSGMQVNGVVTVSGELLFAHAEGRVVRLNETITANQVAISVNYDGKATVIPSFRQTNINMEIQ